MTEERLAEWEQLFAEELEGQTPVWLLGWAVVAKRGGNDLMAEVRQQSALIAKILAIASEPHDPSEYRNNEHQRMDRIRALLGIEEVR